MQDSDDRSGKRESDGANEPIRDPEESLWDLEDPLAGLDDDKPGPSKNVYAVENVFSDSEEDLEDDDPPAEPEAPVVDAAGEELGRDTPETGSAELGTAADRARLTEAAGVADVDEPADHDEEEEADAVSSAAADESAGEPPLEPSRNPRRRLRKLLNLTFKPFEWLLTVAVLGAIFVAGGYALLEAWKFPKSSDLRSLAAMPVEGQFIRIDKVEDFWRKPRVTGVNPDRPRLETKVLPVMRLTLGGGNGRLRFYFRDGDGELVGDPRTLNVADGRFEITGEATAEVSSTIGFDHASRFGEYKYQTGEYWSVEVREGPPEGQGENFKVLFKQDIGVNLEGELYLEPYE